MCVSTSYCGFGKAIIILLLLPAVPNNQPLRDPDLPYGEHEGSMYVLKVLQSSQRLVGSKLVVDSLGIFVHMPRVLPIQFVPNYLLCKHVFQSCETIT